MYFPFIRKQFPTQYRPRSRSRQGIGSAANLTTSHTLSGFPPILVEKYKSRHYRRGLFQSLQRSYFHILSVYSKKQPAFYPFIEKSIKKYLASVFFSFLKALSFLTCLCKRSLDPDGLFLTQVYFYILTMIIRILMYLLHLTPSYRYITDIFVVYDDDVDKHNHTDSALTAKSTCVHPSEFGIIFIIINWRCRLNPN